MNWNNILKVYSFAFKKANQAFIKNLIIIPAMIASYLILLSLAKITAPLGLVGGLIMGLSFIALLSMYYGWIKSAVNMRRLRWSDLTEFDYGLFSQVMSVAFIFWIVFDLLLGSFSLTTQNSLIKICAQLLAFIVFNSLPEVLYLQGLESFQALSKSFEFIKEKWVEWFLPMLLILAWPVLVVPNDQLLKVIAVKSDPLLPFKIIFDTWPTEYILQYIGIPVIGLAVSIFIPLALGHWYMLFRANLFERIEAGQI
jgi:hypothetical protein